MCCRVKRVVLIDKSVDVINPVPMLFSLFSWNCTTISSLRVPVGGMGYFNSIDHKILSLYAVQRHTFMILREESMVVEKPTLLELRRSYDQLLGKQITSRQVAEKAGVPVADEFMMELGCPVSLEVASRVIKAFSILTGQQYSLRDITVSIKDAGSIVPPMAKGK